MCKFSVFTFESDISACSRTCLRASRVIFPDVLKKETCQDKKEEEMGKRGRERERKGMKDTISQFRSDETSWRISM